MDPAGHDPVTDDVTRLLELLQRGDADAADRLVPLVYHELREVAAAYMRSERPDHTLQPTALVHEAYLRLVQQREVHWRGRSHFLGVAAQAMRRILVDHARRRAADKRGGGRIETLVENVPGTDAPVTVDLIALDRALERLAERDPRAARIVELRHFGGLDVPGTAEVLGVSTATVKRDWRHARTWLRRELGGGANAPDAESPP